jgi:hypothetical protein
MPRHHHPSRRGTRRYRAVLAGALLTLLTRRQHQPRRRLGRGRHPLAGGGCGPSHHGAGRRGRRSGRWSQ